MTGFSLVRPLVFRLDPERAHRLTIRALATVPPREAPAADPSLRVSLAGIEFPNPVGLAAGFDKNAEVPDAMLGLGFGFVEVGTVTPLPQSGNPKPRIFRLPAERGVINRLGFNNDGHAAALARLQARKAKRRPKTVPGIVGVNIGANKDAVDRIADYETGTRTFRDVADYLTVNISSPNTPGLRALQDPAALDELLVRVCEARGPFGPSGAAGPSWRRGPARPRGDKPSGPRRRRRGTTRSGVGVPPGTWPSLPSCSQVSRQPFPARFRP